jgi:hypothetical protein
MKKPLVIFCLAALVIALAIGGCGLVSGTMFFSKSLDNSLTANNSTSIDATFNGAVVDFTTESDWDRISVDGIEDMCIRVTVQNHLATAVSGEVWVTPDTVTSGITSVNGIINRGGFRIFHGLALTGNQTRTFTCAETFGLLENVDRLVDVVGTGRFAVWGLGDQDHYNLTFSGVVLGIHVTGSLN